MKQWLKALRSGSTPAPAKLLVVDLIAKHDVQAHEKREARATVALGRPRRCRTEK